jgi:predicted RNA-binding protein YlxR (DUF448 family)
MAQKSAPKVRKVPLRMCVGCREMRPKKELMRVVRSPEGSVSIDKAGKAPGRGAYVCRGEVCLARAVKQKQLERALECPIGEPVFAQLRAELAGLPDG